MDPKISKHRPAWPVALLLTAAALQTWGFLEWSRVREASARTAPEAGRTAAAPEPVADLERRLAELKPRVERLEAAVGAAPADDSGVARELAVLREDPDAFRTLLAEELDRTVLAQRKAQDDQKAAAEAGKQSERQQKEKEMKVRIAMQILGIDDKQAGTVIDAVDDMEVKQRKLMRDFVEEYNRTAVGDPAALADTLTRSFDSAVFKVRQNLTARQYDTFVSALETFGRDTDRRPLGDGRWLVIKRTRTSYSGSFEDPQKKPVAPVPDDE